MNHQFLKSTFLIFIVLIVSIRLFASVKKIGTPLVKNYDIALIPAGTQTWMIDKAVSGLSYFANNDGMLEFDGAKWRIYPLPQETVVRSVKATSDGRIYVGGHNELGFFKANQFGQLIYHSLYHLLPESHKDCGEIWKIFELNGRIIFQSFSQLMIYQDELISVIEAPDMFHFSYLINNELIIIDQTKGLYKLGINGLENFRGTEKLNGKLIWGILPKGNNIIIATADEGIYEYNGLDLLSWSNPVAELLQVNQVFCALAIGNHTYAFGTIQDGLIICDTAGNLFQHINIDKGLQNNTVLSMQLDQHDNLWLGLDNGIDYVEINSPLTFFSTYNNLSSGYTAVVHDGLLYLGTNRGVFYQDWEKLVQGNQEDKFQLVPGTQGQVWSLEVIDGTLFCGHNSGIFIIEGTQSEMLSNVQGGWTFIQPPDQNDVVICGTYTFLVKFKKLNGKWTQGVPVKGFKESSRNIVNASARSIWISHGYKGIFRAHFNESFDSVVKVDFYDNNHGFPSNKDISVFELYNRPVFTTGNGIYKYDDESNTFVQDDMIANRLSRTDMNWLREDKQGNIWYFTPMELGVYRPLEDGKYSHVEIPFRELRGKFIKWFQFVYPYNEKNLIIGTQTGFVHYTTPYPKNYQQTFKTIIRSMKILSGIDSLIYKGAPTDVAFSATIPYKFNHLQFEFAANDLNNNEQVKYLIKLEGFEDDWVDWQNQTIRQFTNLRHGSYTFKVKAINLFDVESETATIAFNILPPWYLSRYAFVAYMILFLLLIIFAAKYIRYRVERSKKAFEEEQRQLFTEREKQLEIETLMAEKELIKMRNEKLQSEKTQKDKELANTTMQIIQKSKSLTAIKSDLRKLLREMGKHTATNQVHGIIKKINKSIDSDKQWEVFESHFENVHEEFLKRLKENYPELSPRELKLCAYLRLNISSKEIANLMNISVRGVEISRYRLRKKLGLEHDTNLADFIISF